MMRRELNNTRTLLEQELRRVRGIWGRWASLIETREFEYGSKAEHAIAMEALRLMNCQHQMEKAIGHVGPAPKQE